VTVHPVSAPPDPIRTPIPAPPRVPKITLLLVLGHQFDRLVREGVVKDYAEIARITGLTRARVTQITGLVFLAPNIQEPILRIKTTSQGVAPVHERSLRGMITEPDWGTQRFLFCRLPARVH
jgi:hypothetical protein